MTSEVLFSTAGDAFVENDVFCLRRDDNLSKISVAAISWHCLTDDVYLAHLHCGKKAVSECSVYLHNYELWLLACHSAWQFDNVVTRRFKLWKSLERRGMRCPKGRIIDEHLLETSQGIKWFSAVQFAASDYHIAMQIVKEEQASVIVAVPKQSDEFIDSIVQTAWRTADIGPSLDLLSAIINEHGLLFWLVGAFDDREAGVVVFGDPKDMNNILL